MINKLSKNLNILIFLSVITILLAGKGAVSLNGQSILTNVPFSQLEASQYNIGLNGVAWSDNSTLQKFYNLYTTGYFTLNTNNPKAKDWYGPGSEGLISYEKAKAPPAILGPNPFTNDPSVNIEHLQDNHHRVSGLYLLSTIFTNGYSSNVTVTPPTNIGVSYTTNIGAAPTTVYVTQIADWSGMTLSDFWTKMEQGNTGGITNFAPVTINNSNGFWNTTNQPTYLWTYNLGQPMNPLVTPPPMIPQLVTNDDTLRDIAAQVTFPSDYGASTVGYQPRDDASSNNIQDNNGSGKVLYYQEFYWANYLRPLVYLISTPGVTNSTSIPTSGMDSNAPYQFTNYGNSDSANLIAFAADYLCHLPAATYLPGYYLAPITNSAFFPSVAYDSIPFTNNSTLWIGAGGTNISVSNDLVISYQSLALIEGSLSLPSADIQVTGTSSLLISNAGSVSSVNGLIGISTNDVGNRATVTGGASSWVISGDLFVGQFGSANILTISNGGQVSNGLASYGTIIGFDLASSNNRVLVTGTNTNGAASRWDSSNFLEVGYGGSGNSLTISNGGIVSSSIGIIGDQAGANSNSVLINGTGSIWSNSITLLIGSTGSANSLLITGGAIVSGKDGVIGVNAGSINNTVTVSGIGSIWSNSGTLQVGYDGASSQLVVANGGQVFSSNGYVGFDASSTNNVVTVTGSHSLWSNSDTLTIGDNGIGSGGSGVLNVLDGGTVQANSINIVQGTVTAGSLTALGTSAVNLGGGSGKASLNLLTNMSISSLSWGSNGVIALTPGVQTLSVTGGLTNGGGGAFTFLNQTLNNATNTLISFGEQSGYTTDSFSVVGGIQGYSFDLTSNSLSEYIATNANLVISSEIVLNNTLSIGSMLITPTGMLSGTGTLNGNLNSGGTLIPGSTNSCGILTINGNLSLTSTSKLIIPVSGATNSELLVSGTASLGGNLTLLPLIGTSFHFGQSIPFLSANNISGVFSSIDTPTGYRARLSIVGDPVATITIAPQYYTQLALTPNQTNVAKALDSFIPATSGDKLTVSTTLDSLTASQYQAAFNAIMPTLYQSESTTAFNLANAQNQELLQRLWGVRLAGTGFSMSGLADNTPVIEGQGDGGKGVLDSKKDILRPGADNHWGMFVDGNGIFAKATSGNMLPTYNSQSGGITTGLTYKWNDSFGTGIYAGYEGSYNKYTANSGYGNASTLIDNSVRFGVFGTYGHPDGKGFHADGLVGGGYNNYTISRAIAFQGLSRTATSSPGAGELDTLLAGGYDLKHGNWTYGPTTSLQYTYFGAQAVNEQGAQSLDFSSGGWQTSSLLYSLGGHAAYTWQANPNLTVVPQINLSWQHEFLQNPYNINGSLGGSPSFNNTSSAPLSDTLYTGVGVTLEYKHKWNTAFFYNASAGNNNLTSQNIFWSAGVKF